MDGLFPGDLFAYAAAAAANTTAGATTSLKGIFVDAVGAPESTEAWEIVHSGTIDGQRMARFRENIAPQDCVEFGAIAVVATALHVRDGLRLGSVRKIGTHSDYSLRDMHGNPAGVIELAGVSGQYTSDVAARKRKSVERSITRPARIGIVAFGGVELRSEVIA